MSTWTEIDERVLHWLADQPVEFTGLRTDELALRPEPAPFDAIGGLTTRLVDDALRRLEGHGLIVGARAETVSYSHWSNLRVTGQGLQVLGRWPDFDLTTGAAGLRRLLAALARDTALPEHDRLALGSTTDFLANLGDDVVDTTIGEVAAGVGEKLLGP